MSNRIVIIDTSLQGLEGPLSGNPVNVVLFGFNSALGPARGLLCSLVARR